MSYGFYRMGSSVEGKVMPRMTFAGMVQLGRSVTETAPASLDLPKVVLTLTGAEKITEAVGVQQKRVVAKQQGYTGDECSKCSSMRMKMAGHCMVCEDCGETTGCS
jgi:hypothetical protein